jgi:hypothetical protein
MGMPGYAFVTIVTKVDYQNQTVSKEIKLGNHCGLNGLSLGIDFDKSFNDEAGWIYIKNKLFRDLSMLSDGMYKIAKKKRPENFLDFNPDEYFDYVWMPLGEDDEF